MLIYFPVLIDIIIDINLHVYESSTDFFRRITNIF